MIDVSGAGEPKVGGLIPADTLVVFQVEVRPHNLQQGAVLKPWGKGLGVDLALKVVGGPYNGRVIFEVLKAEDPEGKGVDQGLAAVKALLEANGALTCRQVSYSFPSWMSLNGMMGAGRTKIEKSEGYEPKARLATWISPSAKSTAKEWGQVAAQYGLVPGVPYGAQPPQMARPAPQQAFGGHQPAPQYSGRPQPTPHQNGATAQQSVVAAPQYAQPAPPAVQHTTQLPWPSQQQAQPMPSGPAAWPAQQPGYQQPVVASDIPY